MQFDLRAGPGELARKGAQLVEALIKAFAFEAPALAQALEKALPAKEPVLKYKVLQDLHEREGKAYKAMLEAMNREVLAVLQEKPEVRKSLVEEDSEEALLKAMGWVEIPEEVGEALWEEALFKARGHKYIRRVPTGKDKPKYRYYYNVAGGRGLAHQEELQVGAKFAFEHEGEAGHFDIIARDGDRLTIRHDESGHETDLHVDKFAGLLRQQHAKRIETEVARATETRKEAEKYGSEKQIARALEREVALKRHFREFAAPGPKSQDEAIRWAQENRYEGPLNTEMGVEQAEEAIRREGVEHACYFIGGQLVKAINGVLGMTPVTHEHKMEMGEDGNAIYVHNHPSDGFLSEEDVLVAVVANLKEMRACTSTGVWVLRRPDDQAEWLWRDGQRPESMAEIDSAIRQFKIELEVIRARGTNAARTRMDEDVRAAGGNRLEGVNAKGYSKEKWDQYLREYQEKPLIEFFEQVGWKVDFEPRPERRPVARRQLARPEIPADQLAADHLPKVAPALPRAVMSDMGPGGYDQIEAFSAEATDLERQAVVMSQEREYAVMPQAAGFALVSKPKGAVGRETTGAETQVFIRSSTGKGTEALPGEWVIMEADDVIASHNAMSFGQRKEYPEGVQERRYHEVKAEQMKVDRIARSIEPAFLANTNPDAINGAPIVTETGVVLGGNGRAMGVQRAYEMYPESATKLKNYLVSQAHQFGASGAQVSQMKKPVLVRRVQTGDDRDYLTRLGRRMNESLTQGLDPRSEEVAISKFVTKDVVQSLVHYMEPDQTLSDFLTQGRQSLPFVRDLERAGIIDQFNRAKYINQDTGMLNEDGRARVMRVMAARLLPDATVLDNMDQGLRNNLALAVPFFLSAEEKGWDLKDALMVAVKSDNEMSARGYKRNAIGRDDWLRQPTLFGGESYVKAAQEPLPKVLLEIIQEHNGSRKLQAGFKRFAVTADQQAHDYGQQGSMFARPKESMDDALAQAFGLRMAPGASTSLARLAQAGEKHGLLAASFHIDPWVDLLSKAGGVDGAHRMVMHAVTWEAKRLLDAASRASAVHGAPVDLRRALSRLQGFVDGQKEHDPVFARAFAAQPVSGGLLLAILETEAQARGLRSQLGPGQLEKSEVGPYDPSQAQAEADARAYARMKSVLARRGYGSEDFEEGGRLYGYSVNQLIELERELGVLRKAGGPFIGPRGGKWADAAHTIPWDEKRSQPKPGVHWQEHTKRWHHEPFVPDPGDERSKDDPEAWHNFMNRMGEEQATKRNTVLEHHEKGVQEFKNPRSEHHAVLLPDASEPGKWRYSEYDPRGFMGHQAYDTKAEALKELADAGYTEPAKGSLDQFAVTQEWAEGMRANKMIQTSNALRSKGHYEVARKVEDYFYRENRSQEAVDVIHKPAVLEALMRGEVPEELEKSGGAGSSGGNAIGHTDLA